MVLAYGQGNASLEQEPEWKKGREYLAQGRAEDADAVFKALLENHSREPDLHVFLGVSALRLHDAARAETHIRTALSLDATHVEAWTLLGWILMEVRRDYAGAVEAYRRALERRPQSAEAHNNLGVALKKNGDFARALDSFQHAVELRPAYAEAWSNRGWTYVEEKEWRRARTSFESALQVDPKDAGALYGMAHVRWAVRDYAAADQAFRQLIRSSPNFVYWLEWGELQLVRYYWISLLVAGAFFVHARYIKGRRKKHGR
jgi:Tfp pilus assembly protein PilF